MAVSSLTVTGAAHSANAFTEEMIVTATRRTTNTQDIPYNIAAYSGDVLEEQNIEDLSQFARWVPGLTVTDQGLRSSNILTVRGLTASAVNASEGIGNSGGGTVATYLGEVPLYVDLRIVDIERVEVLIGPQGTLYGAGTLGGAVRYIPKKPRTDEMTVEVRGKAYGMSESDDPGWVGDVIFNVPIVQERLAFRGNVGISEIPGFIDYDNLVQTPGVSNPQPDRPGDVPADNLWSKKDADGGSIFNARAALLWNIGDSGELLVSYNYQDMDMGGKTANNTASYDTGKYVSGYRFLEPNQRENHLAAATLIWDFDFAELTSTAGYSKFDEFGNRDQTDFLLNIGYSYPDFPEFAAFTEDTWEDETVTFETRLVSNSDSPLNWIGGVFYSNIDNHQDSKEITPNFPEFLHTNMLFPYDPTIPPQFRPPIPPFPLPTGDLEYHNVVDESIREIAVFGEVGYQLTERWQVTVGARWFDFEDDVTITTDFPIALGFGTPFNAKVDDSDVIFKFNTSLDIDGWLPRMNSGMTYLTISEGYRLGGINAIDACQVPPDLNMPQSVCVSPDEESFKTDTTLNYEIGIKTDWVDGRLNTDLAFFYVQWSDIQLDTITVTGDTPITGNSATP